jgi:hypothetical protein
MTNILRWRVGKGMVLTGIYAQAADFEDEDDDEYEDDIMAPMAHFGGRCDSHRGPRRSHRFGPSRD